MREQQLQLIFFWKQMPIACCLFIMNKKMKNKFIKLYEQTFKHSLFNDKFQQLREPKNFSKNQLIRIFKTILILGFFPDVIIVKMFDSEPRLLQQEAQDAHVALMPYLWTIVIDLAVFFAKYKYTKYGIFLHGIISLFVSLSTLATALPILIEEGIPVEEDESYQQRHFIIGLVMIVIVLVQILLGCFSKIFQMMAWNNSFTIFLLNTFHKYLGYALILLGKIQVFLILNLDSENTSLFWGLLSAQIAFFLLWLPRTLFFPTLQQKILPYYPELQLKKIKRLNQLQQSKFLNLGTFANYVYNIDILDIHHPAGSRIIKTLDTKEFDRYLYGMYRTERQPKIPANSHSYKVLNLLGDPIAKIVIPPLYTGFETDVLSVSLSKVIQVSDRGQIYQVYLTGENLNTFEYKGYQSLHQLGRFYSLTINQKVTRLYTSVGFLAQSNVNFLDRFFFTPNGVSIKPQAMKIQYTDLQVSERKGLKGVNEFALLMKKYPQGKLTSQLIEGDVKQLHLSSPRGQGLKLDQLKRGTIIIVAGGTGLYPFSDLIDLLFKTYLLFNRQELKNQILAADPLLVSNPFSQFQFKFYISVNFIEDIHPLTFAQLNELSKYENFLKLYLRVSKKNKQSQLHQVMNKNVVFMPERFTQVFDKLVLKKTFEKIYLCGPPVMSQEFIELFDKAGITLDKYMIV